MDRMSLTARLLTFAAAAAIMLTVFDSVVALSETLPDVRVARALELEARTGAPRGMLVATGQPASAPGQ